jgi:AAA family ATP:ADP antiporter
LGDDKRLSLFLLIPFILLYSRLVDRLYRWQLLYCYSAFYAVGSLVFVYFLGHPTIGMPNTATGSDRWIGWLFYFFVEGFQPFLVSVFWAFANSVFAPAEVKSNYIVLVAGSKIGGLIAAGFGWWFLHQIRIGRIIMSDAASHQVLLVLAAALLVALFAVIWYLVRVVPKTYFHGYEAAYKADVRHTREERRNFTNVVSGFVESVLSGLRVFYRYPYAFGIFSIIFFWEVINVAFNYVRIGVGQAENTTTAGLSAFLLEQMFYVHVTGLLIVLLGTRWIIEFLGERRSLMLVPMVVGVLIGYCLLAHSTGAVLVAFVIMRSIHYALSSPLRESLYIPTTKEIRFKSKSWTEAFGGKFAKATGAQYNVLMKKLQGRVAAGVLPAETVMNITVGFFACIIAAWIYAAHCLGKRYEKAVKNNEVIGD